MSHRESIVAKHGNTFRNGLPGAVKAALKNPGCREVQKAGKVMVLVRTTNDTTFHTFSTLRAFHTQRLELPLTGPTGR